MHCIGIGGIGISAIARMMLAQGKEVQGSDVSLSSVINGLIDEGVVFLGLHNANNISAIVDLVIYTTAIQEDNPELLRAQELGIPTLSYPETLGRVSSGKHTIAISGTHGKTTTTAMIANVFQATQYQPTVILGSLFTNTKTNFIPGESNYFIVEACEYRRSFLNLKPNILVITNIDTDHLDYYEDLADIQSAFHELAEKIPSDGFLVCNTQDENLTPVLQNLSCAVINYTESLKEVPKLKVLGEHNRLNAAATITVARIVKIPTKLTQKSLMGFCGTWRRGEYRGKTKSGALVFDDYAHHPTEIQATLKGFREKYPDKDINVVFQPHLFSRTRQLFDEFTGSFADADFIIVTDVYAARERNDGRVSINELAQKIPNGTHIREFSEITEELSEKTSENSIIITMGAGDIYKIADSLIV